MRAKIGTRETRCHGPWSACSTGPTGPTAAARAPFTGPSFSASAFTDNELRVPFLRGLQIPCSSNGIEIAVFTGEVHLFLHETVSETGHARVKAMTNAQGITGVGLVTGDAYHMNGGTQEEFTFDVDALPFDYDMVNNFHVTSSGAAGNIVAHETLRITYDADGNATVTVVNFHADCK